jgi:hypothetical protein
MMYFTVAADSKGTLVIQRAYTKTNTVAGNRSYLCSDFDLESAIIIDSEYMLSQLELKSRHKVTLRESKWTPSCSNQLEARRT